MLRNTVALCYLRKVSDIQHSNDYLKETDNTDITRKVKTFAFTSMYIYKSDILQKRLNSAEQWTLSPKLSWMVGYDGSKYWGKSN